MTIKGLGKEEFIRRFNLHVVASSTHNYKHHLPLKPAAVLIGLVENTKPENITRVYSHAQSLAQCR